MTKKDYQLIAEAIKAATLKTNVFAVAHCAVEIATRLKQANPKFDQEKFLKACELTPEKFPHLYGR